MSKIHFQIADEFSWWAVDYITKQNLVKLYRICFGYIVRVS